MSFDEVLSARASTALARPTTSAMNGSIVLPALSGWAARYSAARAASRPADRTGAPSGERQASGGCTLSDSGANLRPFAKNDTVW
jgi:hypothetical protein